LYIEGGDREFVPEGGEKGRELNRVVDSGTGAILAVVEMDTVVDGRGRREMLEVVGKVMMIITLLHRWERRQNAGLKAPLVEPGEVCQREDGHSPEVSALIGTTACQRGERPAGGGRRQVTRGRE
jgi:hypothetical protein